VKDEGIYPLFTVMALSRLIHPTTIGNRYCAKIYPIPEADPPIEALTTVGANPDVTVGDISRDWLSPSHGEELRQLMPWVPETRPMLERVHRAFWKYEDAARTYFLDSRFPVVVAGLEALITVEKYKNGSRFVRRVGKLATEFGVNLSETELEQANEVRSELAHGQSFLHDLHTVLPADEQPPFIQQAGIASPCSGEKVLAHVGGVGRLQGHKDYFPEVRKGGHRGDGDE
jgi:hypothetical protein